MGSGEVQVECSGVHGGFVTKYLAVATSCGTCICSGYLGCLIVASFLRLEVLRKSWTGPRDVLSP